MPKKKRTEELLKEMKAVDTTAREIRSIDMVDFHCECGEKTSKLFKTALESFKLKKVASRCRSCSSEAQSKAASARKGDKNPFFGKTHTKEVRDIIGKKQSEYQKTLDSIEVQAKLKKASEKSYEIYGGNPMHNKTIKKKHLSKVQSDEFREKLRKAGITNRDNTQDFSQMMSDYSTAFHNSELSKDHKKKSSEYVKENLNNPHGVYFEKRTNGLKTFHNNKDKMESAFNKRKETCIAVYGFENPMQNEDIRAKSHGSKDMSKPEKYINEFLTNNGFDFRYEPKGLGKSWDFVVYIGGKPDLIIESDGEYNHGLSVDPNCSKVNGLKDPMRFSIMPDKTKLIVVDSKRVREVPAEILRVYGIDYQSWIDEMFNYCKELPFPYPEYTEKRMLRDWKNLLNMYDYSSYKSSIRPCNSVMTSFHKSIYHCRKNRSISPFDAWSNDELLRKVIENRTVYASKLSSQNIARGFEKSNIAQRISLFQPSLARYLLTKYSPDAKTVLDPMAGYSGRMLGSCSLGLQYTGYDINQTTVSEANEIIKFLDLSATCESIAIEDNKDYNHYDVLITCPPYGMKEIWEDGVEYKGADYYIDQCLGKFNCDTFIFVVDKTDKYKDYIIDTIENDSHISKNKEYVIVIKG